MSKHIKLLLAAVIALIAIAAGASTASAASFSISPNGNVTATSLGLISFSSSFTTVTCRMTLLLRFLEGLIAKTAGVKVGNVTRVSVPAAGCNRGISAKILNAEGAAEETQTVEWLITYASITGTLPNNVTAVLVNIVGAVFLLTIPSIIGTQTCLFEGSPGVSLGVTGSNPYTSGLIRSLETSIGLKTAELNTGACPANGRLNGSWSISPALTLIRL